ncbi:MAG: hypothetical protein ACJA0G_000445 [Kangiellaceae bacterium]|jgi:hypothetical protein
MQQTLILLGMNAINISSGENYAARYIYWLIAILDLVLWL